MSGDGAIDAESGYVLRFGFASQAVAHALRSGKVKFAGALERRDAVPIFMGFEKVFVSLGYMTKDGWKLTGKPASSKTESALSTMPRFFECKPSPRGGAWALGMLQDGQGHMVSDFDHYRVAKRERVVRGLPLPIESLATMSERAQVARSRFVRRLDLELFPRNVEDLSPMDEPRGRRFERLRQSYRSAALLLLNALVVLVGVNLAATVALALAGGESREPFGPVVARYGVDAVLRAYPGVARDDVLSLQRETWTRGLSTDELVSTRERPFAGRFVTVTRAGYRASSEPGPWPPDPALLNVFVFGGSTTFGYGVSDGETVPSCIQRLLAARHPARPPRVYNFGCALHYSTFERASFERLLGSGVTPDLALFVDGLNESLDAGNPELLFGADPVPEDPSSQPASRLVGGLVEKLPVVRAVHRFLDRPPAVAPGDNPGALARVPEIERDPALAARIAAPVIKRYRRNKEIVELVAAARKVPVAFVWQPVPCYACDPACAPFERPAHAALVNSRLVYPAFARLAESGELGPSFLWCADVQRGASEILYCDAVHYSAAGCERLARRIVALLDERGLLEPPR